MSVFVPDDIGEGWEFMKSHCRWKWGPQTIWYPLHLLPLWQVPSLNCHMDLTN